MLFSALPSETSSVHVRQSAVTVFGVIPASILCLFLLGGLVGVLGEYLETGSRDDLVTIVWCALAVIGTFALFFSIEEPPGPIAMIGLGCGIAAMLGLDGLSIGQGAWKLLFIAPMITAVSLIIEGLGALSNDSSEPDI